MIITLTNDFHGTSSRLRLQPDEYGVALVRKSTARAHWRRLCGVAGCTCGGEFGERMPSRVAVLREDWHAGIRTLWIDTKQCRSNA